MCPNMFTHIICNFKRWNHGCKCWVPPVPSKLRPVFPRLAQEAATTISHCTHRKGNTHLDPQSEMCLTKRYFENSRTSQILCSFSFCQMRLYPFCITRICMTRGFLVSASQKLTRSARYYVDGMSDKQKRKWYPGSASGFAKLLMETTGSTLPKPTQYLNKWSSMNGLIRCAPWYLVMLCRALQCVEVCVCSEVWFAYPDEQVLLAPRLIRERPNNNWSQHRGQTAANHSLPSLDTNTHTYICTHVHIWICTHVHM